MLLSVTGTDFIAISGNEDFELKGNILTAKSMIILKVNNQIEVKNEDGVIQGDVLKPGVYSLTRVNQSEITTKVKAYDLIEPKSIEDIEYEGINYRLLKILTRIKEINLLDAIVKLDSENPDTIIKYDELYQASKNRDFIPELSVYLLLKETKTIELFKKIFEYRNELYTTRTEANKNHVIFGINNPVIWLDASIKTKRVACGGIQYRKGLHIREFDLMVYNLNLVNRFRLNDTKIKYANIMRDYNLL